MNNEYWTPFTKAEMDHILPALPQIYYCGQAEGDDDDNPSAPDLSASTGLQHRGAS